MKRQWILWLLLLVFVWVVIGRYTEASELTQTLARGDWGLVAAAAALQFAFYAVYALVYQMSFYYVGVRCRVREILPVVFASVFVNVVIPTGGTSGVALFVDDASRRGESAARAAAGVLLVLITDFSAFAVLLGLGMAYLAVAGDLAGYVIAAAVILLAIILSLGAALMLGLWRPHLLLRTLQWVQRAANRIAGWIRKPSFLPQDWASKNAMDFAAASVAIAAAPWRPGKAYLVALAAHLINLSSLYVLFLAFYKPTGLGVVVAGYAIGNLFWIVSIAPQGVGVVEGAMTLVFGSLGVPVSVAAIVVLAYRGLGFWLPLVVGFVLLRTLRSFRAGPPSTFGAERRGTAREH